MWRIATAATSRRNQRLLSLRHTAAATAATSASPYRLSSSLQGERIRKRGAAHQKRRRRTLCGSSQSLLDGDKVSFYHQRQQWQQQRLFSTDPTRNEEDIDDNTVSDKAKAAQEAWREFAEQPQPHPSLPSPSDDDDSNLADNNTDPADLLQHPYILPGTATQMFHPDVHMASAPQNWDGYEPETPLQKELQAQIAVVGKPLSIAQYMRACLLDPQHGYYTQAQSKAKADQDDFDALDEWEQELANDDQSNNDEMIDPSSVIGGDFVTAPEMTQMFGECLGIWMTLTAEQQKNSLDSNRNIHSRHWQYVEAGPGKGSLVVDLLRYWEKLGRRASRGRAAIPSKLHLLETSPALRQAQRKCIENDMGELYQFQFPGNAKKKDDPEKGDDDRANEDSDDSSKPTVQIYWHDSLAAFRLWQETNQSKLPTFFICQEFMDALPIYAFEKTKDGWRERMVDLPLRDDIQQREEEEHGISASPTQQPPPADQKAKPRFRIVLSPEVTDAAKALLRLAEDGLLPSEKEKGLEVPTGTIMEVNPEAMAFTQDMSKIVTEQGGGALIIDYGQEGSRDSIRAYGQHKQLHFLSSPGQVDVTADVDFGALKHVVNDWARPAPTPTEVDMTDTASRQQQPPERAHAFGPLPQGSFLMSMGIKERAVKLSEAPETTEEQAETIYMALVKLCSAEEMGERFKVMAIVPSSRGKVSGELQPPPGFPAKW